MERGPFEKDIYIADVFFYISAGAPRRWAFALIMFQQYQHIINEKIDAVYYSL